MSLCGNSIIIWLDTTKCPLRMYTLTPHVEHQNISKFNCKSFSIKLGGLTIPTSSLTSNDKGITVQASGINMKVNADWHYREKSWYSVNNNPGYSTVVK